MTSTSWLKRYYLGLGDQAADLDWLDRSRGGDRDGVGRLGGAGEARGSGRDRRGDDNARQRGGAGLTAGLSINDADLVNGRRRGQWGRQFGSQHDGPLEELRGRHHGRRRGRGDGNVGGRGRFWPNLVTTDSQSENDTKNDPTLLSNTAVELWPPYYLTLVLILQTLLLILLLLILLLLLLLLELILLPQFMYQQLQPQLILTTALI